jgi:hypothetical protein
MRKPKTANSGLLEGVMFHIIRHSAVGTLKYSVDMSDAPVMFVRDFQVEA